MANSIGSTSQSICWNCARSLQIRGVACSWAWSGIPVPGWKAIRNDISTGKADSRVTKKTVSYRVQSCPEFLSDADYNTQLKKIKTKENNTMVNEKKAPDTAAMERFDINTKEKAPKPPTITIKERSISLPAIEVFDAGKEVIVLISKDGTQVAFMNGEDGFPVSATGRGGAGRIIYCKTAIARLKKKGIELPQEAELQTGTGGVYYVELKPQTSLMK